MLFVCVCVSLLCDLIIGFAVIYGTWFYVRSAVRKKQGLEKDVTDVKVLLQQQEFTPADVQRLREERKDRLRQEESLTKMLDAMDVDILKEEMEIAKLLEKVISQACLFGLTLMK